MRRCIVIVEPKHPSLSPYSAFIRGAEPVMHPPRPVTATRWRSSHGRARARTPSIPRAIRSFWHSTKLRPRRGSSLARKLLAMVNKGLSVPDVLRNTPASAKGIGPLVPDSLSRPWRPRQSRGSSSAPSRERTSARRGRRRSRPAPSRGDLDASEGPGGHLGGVEHALLRPEVRGVQHRASTCARSRR